MDQIGTLKTKNRDPKLRLIATQPDSRQMRVSNQKWSTGNMSLTGVISNYDTVISNYDTNEILLHTGDIECQLRAYRLGMIFGAYMSLKQGPLIN